MVFRLTILGYEVWCLELAFASVEEVEVEEDLRVGGGAAHDFERDTAPLNPADHYGEWEDRHRPFGFR